MEKGHCGQTPQQKVEEATEWNLAINKAKEEQQKAETVEKAAERLALEKHPLIGKYDLDAKYRFGYKQGFIDAANWQKQQSSNKYIDAGWINIGIKQPPVNTEIWIWHLIYNQCVQIKYTSTDELCYFKYWMPLPNPPKE